MSAGSAPGGSGLFHIVSRSQAPAWERTSLRSSASPASPLCAAAIASTNPGTPTSSPPQSLSGSRFLPRLPVAISSSVHSTTAGNAKPSILSAPDLPAVLRELKSFTARSSAGWWLLQSTGDIHPPMNIWAGHNPSCAAMRGGNSRKLIPAGMKQSFKDNRVPKLELGNEGARGSRANVFLRD